MLCQGVFTQFFRGFLTYYQDKLNGALASLKTPEIFSRFALSQMLSHHVYQNLEIMELI